MERHEALLPVMQKIAYLKRDSIPCKIEEGLYLGSVGAAMNRSTLKSLNITHVLMVANSLSPPFPSDFVYKVIGGMTFSLYFMSFSTFSSFGFYYWTCSHQKWITASCH
ncbi:unnamed protein product [Cuscuta campestris]|uniref:Uncharacterized protein n=1 Tax=Cuscuta campestris TaxID=132261 RepID=A0A484LC20_9ASTE|nr:unnamed protein product [Cuscuta campestris]